MEKLKYVLLGSLFLLTLPQVLADIGDTRGIHVASTGDTKEDFDDCYVCSIPFLQPW